jgi:hypothetical protein
VSPGVGSWPPETGIAGLEGLPDSIGDWSLTPVAAGVWVSTARDVPSPVRELVAEPGRPGVVIDASGPDPRTDELLSQLFPALAAAGCTTLRLVLSAAADRYAGASRAHGLDLIAAEAPVTITPYGYAVVLSAGPVTSGGLPQWRRCLPSGVQSAAGVLSPSPAWERGLAAGLAVGAGEHVTVRRVPAGLELRLREPDAGRDRMADAMWPDPERVTVVVDGPGRRGPLWDSLAQLLPLLPLGATDGVRLCWPRAGAVDAGQALQELARSWRTDLIAPAADLSPSGDFWAVCHGPAGAAPWLRFTPDGDVRVLGSLHPVPPWEGVLTAADLDGLAGGLAVEHVAAGLYVYRPGTVERGLATTARSLLPAPSGMTIVMGGDARGAGVRQDLEQVLSRLPAGAAGSLRIVLAGAGAGGRDSYAQFLADTFGCQIVAPAGEWTATPDGRLLARSAPGRTPGTGTEADAWPAFSPGGGHGATAAAEPETSQPAPAQPEESVPQEPVPQEPVPQEAAADVVTGTLASSGTVPLLSRSHRSTVQERLRYREAATRYQTHAVVVRRVLTQRPGLRTGLAGEAGAAVVTDFAAVLDFLDEDRPRFAAALRLAGTTGDARVACALSGLRRLPSFTGAVFSSASLLGVTACEYVTGAMLIEPAFVDATSSRLVALEGDIDYVIWSETGKRIAALAADAGSDEIVFAAGTAYKVLQVDPARPGSSRTRVFLRESARYGHGAASGQRSPAGPPDNPLDEMDSRVLERLVSAAARRGETVASDQRPARRTGGAPPIGLDARGLPFLEAATAT